MAGLALAVLVGGCYSGRGDWQGGDLADTDPAPDDDEPDQGEPAGCEDGPSLGGALTWRLTASQYDNTVRDLLGAGGSPGQSLAAGDGRVGVFSDNTDAPVSETLVEQYGLVARTLAEQALGDPAGLLPCDPGQGDQACAREFIVDFGARAYRRPLSPAQIDDYLALYRSGEQESFSAGIRMVLEAMLQSPFFLYRVETGTPVEGREDVLALDDWELASRLSYFLTDSMPDEELFAAADAGALSSAEGLVAQADRLLHGPRAVDALARLHFEWLGLEQVEGKPKQDPDWDEALADDALDEARRLIAATIVEGDARLETLLTSRASEASPRLAALAYGRASTSDAPFELPPQHAGLLLRPAFLAAHSHGSGPSPVLSGHILRTRLLCDPLPPPPDAADTTPPPPDPSMSTRQRYSLMLDDPQCAGCHQRMNPLGFAFLGYDAVGRYRTREGTLPIDASGELLGTDVDGEFRDATELIEQLVDSEQVARCVADHWLHFAIGHAPAPADECARQQVHARFVDSGGDIRELVRAIVETDAFRYRLARQE